MSGERGRRRRATAEFSNPASETGTERAATRVRRERGRGDVGVRESTDRDDRGSDEINPTAASVDGRKKLSAIRNAYER